MELIVNVTEDWGIGFGDRLLVRISADLRRFRALTEGKTVILGRKTLETFPGGRPLKNRRNLIFSANPAFRAEGAEVVRSLDELRTALKPGEHAAVIGGASVYALLLPYCETAHVTRTLTTLPADRFFPNLDEDENWEKLSESEIFEENGIRFRYVTYRSRSPRKL